MNDSALYSLLIAIIDQARRDAINPTGCGPWEKGSLMQDAQGFLTWLEGERADILRLRTIPRPPPTVRGTHRWEFDEPSEAWQRQRRNFEKKNRASIWS